MANNTMKFEHADELERLREKQRAYNQTHNETVRLIELEVAYALHLRDNPPTNCWAEPENEQEAFVLDASGKVHLITYGREWRNDYQQGNICREREPLEAEAKLRAARFTCKTFLIEQNDGVEFKPEMCDTVFCLVLGEQSPEIATDIWQAEYKLIAPERSHLEALREAHPAEVNLILEAVN